MIVACDLDRTLVHSARDVGGVPAGCAVVERHLGEDVSLMTVRAVGLLAEVAAVATFVPVTTRSAEQCARVRLEVTPRWVVVANGGTILDNGRVDRVWDARVRSRLAAGASLADMAAAVGDLAPGWLDTVRERDRLFISARVVGTAPPGWDRFLARAVAGGWKAGRVGRKFYLLPAHVTKAAAVAHLAERTGEPVLAAAGDSELDRGMLALAAHPLVPGGSELAQAAEPVPGAWQTPSAHAAGGEELLERVLALLRAGPQSRRPRDAGVPSTAHRPSASAHGDRHDRSDAHRVRECHGG